MPYPTEWIATAEGVRRRIVTDGEKLMQVEVHFQSGAIGALHSHPHEQTTLVLKGRVRFTIGESDQEVAVGQYVYIPSNVKHGLVALEESLLLDTFSPPREDFR